MKSADDKRFKKQKTLYSARDREVAKRQNTTKKRQHGPDKGSHITTKTIRVLIGSSNQCIPAPFDVTKKQ